MNLEDLNEEYINSGKFDEKMKSLLREIYEEEKNRTTIQKIKDKIREFTQYGFIYKCKIKINNLKTFIINVFRYRKILAEDRDWDYNYLLVMLQQKLKYMYEYQDNYSHICDEENEIYKSQLNECITILDRLIKNDYILNYETYEEADKMEIADKDRLFNIMRDNIFSWWD